VPFSNRVLTRLAGATSPTNWAPTWSNGGRVDANASSITHWLNGSVTTGQESSTPCSRASSRWRSSVACVIRSTMESGNRTQSSTQRASAGSRCSASASTHARASTALSGWLSQDSTVSPFPPARHRCSSPATR